MNTLRQLFAEALSESIGLRYAEELSSAPTVTVSDHHEQKMKRILLSRRMRVSPLLFVLLILALLFSLLIGIRLLLLHDAQRSQRYQYTEAVSSPYYALWEHSPQEIEHPFPAASITDYVILEEVKAD